MLSWCQSYAFVVSKLCFRDLIAMLLFQALCSFTLPQGVCRYTLGVFLPKITGNALFTAESEKLHNYTFTHLDIWVLGK